MVRPEIRRETYVSSPPGIFGLGWRVLSYDRWLAFSAVKQPGRNQIFIAPFPEGAGSDENAWIPVTDGFHGDSHMAWSADGRMLYFLSDRDGSMCLWAQTLGPGMKPQGPLKSILHFHGTKRSIRNVTFNHFTLTAAAGEAHIQPRRTEREYMDDLPNPDVNVGQLAGNWR